MTGEITLRGKVLPIGGVKEKVLAARAAKLKTVILPKLNERDLVDVPEPIKRDMTFHFVEHVEDVLADRAARSRRGRTKDHPNVPAARVTHCPSRNLRQHRRNRCRFRVVVLPRLVER